MVLFPTHESNTCWPKNISNTKTFDTTFVDQLFFWPNTLFFRNGNICTQRFCCLEPRGWFCSALLVSFVVTSWNDLWPDYGKSLQVCHIQVFKARELKLCMVALNIFLNIQMGQVCYIQVLKARELKLCMVYICISSK